MLLFFFSVVLPALVLSVEGTLVNMSDVEQHSKLCENSELLGDKVKMIKSGLKRPAGINIGLFGVCFVYFVVYCLIPKLCLAQFFFKEVGGTLQFLVYIEVNPVLAFLTVFHDFSHCTSNS